MNKLILLVALGVFCRHPAFAQEQPGEASGDVREFGTTITGNQEQPKVLYIVPWKSATLGESAIPYLPVDSQVEKVFRHVERREHIRYLEFMQALEESD